jgi:uncharacterized RDD family membrane protein YckC
MTYCTETSEYSFSPSQHQEDASGKSASASAETTFSPSAESSLPISTSTVEEPRAGFWLRFVAFSIDCVVLSVFSLLLFLSGFASVTVGARWSDLPPDASRSFSLLSLWLTAVLIAAAAYFTILHSEYGQTIGKSLLGLEVRTKHGDLLSYSHALLRYLAYGVSVAFFGLGFLSAALTSGKRAWHDFLAGSIVIAHRCQKQ